jgi:hypothetical protein
MHRAHQLIFQAIDQPVLTSPLSIDSLEAAASSAHC